MLHQVLADGGIRRAISHAAGGDEGQQSAFAETVEAFDEKVVVNGPRGLPLRRVFTLAVRPIVDGEISEGDVTRYEVEPPGLACLDLFEAFDANRLPRVVSREESQDAPRHEVFFKRDDLRLFARQRAGKDTHPSRRIEHSAEG